MKLASEMVVDAVVPGDRLRDGIRHRIDRALEKREARPAKKRPVTPV
jgi:hypothetical protein